MLPYTFAIGSSDSWFKRFYDIELNKPEWFVTQNEFKINNIIYGRGIGKSKKEAEQKAAFDAYKKSAK